MDFLKFAINRPVSIAVGAILILLFGFIGLFRLPVQLAPDTEQPQIEVQTFWSGASPSEIESEVVEKQEEKLKSLENLVKMESSSYNDFARITLTFGLETDIDTAMLRVSNKLNEVADYPENVEKPILYSSGAAGEPIIWLQLKTISGDPSRIVTYQTYFENEIQQYLERVDGVASLMVFGGTAQQLEIVLDPSKMARYGITISQVSLRVAAANKDISAGSVGIDQTNYRIRTSSKFQNQEDPLDVVIFEDGMKRVYLRDIAFTRIGYETQFVSVMDDGAESIVIGIKRQQGANVPEVVRRAREVVDWLNAGPLQEQNLTIRWVYDEAPYIFRAISIVKQNVFIGGFLAICVLMLFLRSFRSTLTTALAIPVSAVGTFIFLWLFNRNLNVVSLAGISFAVGMLVDNSIVVLENIDRHRKMNKKIADAVYDGAREVYGAVLASTLTTVAVFLPVIFIQEEAGQLFRDIAIAITFSILISLAVSVTLIPAAMNLLYRRSAVQAERFDIVRRMGSFFVSLIMSVSAAFQKTVLTRTACVLIFTALSIGTVWMLMPKAEYLPLGNQNFIMSILIPPPGYSAQKRLEVGKSIFAQIEPYMNTAGGRDGIPPVKGTFYVSGDMISLCGTMCTDEHETEAAKLIPMLNRIIYSIPGMLGISIQPGIFESDLGRGRTVDINISGENLDDMVLAGRILYGALGQAIPGSQIRPVPSLEISYPETNIVPDRRKLAASGLSESELGAYVDVLMTGRKIGEYRPEGAYQIDLVLRDSETDIKTPEDILNTSIVNHHGQLVRIGDVARIDYTQGMTQIDRLEKKRTVRLEVTPSANIALQEAMETIDGIVSQLKEGGKLPSGLSINTGGNADKLTQTRLALQWNILLALVITYLLMASLFENFFYPLIIMFSVPLAAAGGFIGLKLVDAFIAPQPMDVLTMLGFIILIGTVVNNAILIVHQSLNNIRYAHMEKMQAVSESVKNRIRPIFMSAFTSIFGLMPMVATTGSGSEMYRGIGSVLLGGWPCQRSLPCLSFRPCWLFSSALKKTNRFDEIMQG